MRHGAGLFLLLALSACRPQDNESQVNENPKPVEGPPRYEISEPYVHENLAVFLLRLKDAPPGAEDYLMLDEAVAAKVLRIKESAQGASVNVLEFENVGGRPVYLQAGDTVKGGQQDRTIAVEMVLPPKSGRQAVPVFCVEPGRWSTRAGGSAGSGRVFDAATVALATNEQKLATRFFKDQSQVWSAGKETNEGLVRSAGTAAQDSYVLASEDSRVQKAIQPYLDVLERVVQGKKDVVGMAFAVNGKINFADAYANTGLFRKLWPRLLKSCAVEALSKRDGTKHGQVTVSDVRWLLEEPLKGSKTRVETALDTRTHVLHTPRAVRFRSEWKERLLHSSWGKID